MRSKTVLRTRRLSQVAHLTLAAFALALSLSASVSAQTTETVLFNFGPPNSGLGPQGPLVFDTVGNLYGTTQTGGNYGYGTVFKLAPTAGGEWTQSVLYTFTGQKDGGAPYAGLTIDAAGNLYGTTVMGGDLHCTEDGGCGTVFELSSDSSGKWNETVLYAFKGTDGAAPWAGVTFDALGNLYGTTNDGGQGAQQGYGTVFKLTPGSGGWMETVLHVFDNGRDGAYPVAALAVDAAGNLYGTAAEGGRTCNLNGCGVVFKLSPTSNGEWREMVLHFFEGGKDGAVPLAGVTLDATGNLYGTTFYGGANGCPSTGTAGCGVVFELSPDSSGWKEIVLHVFTGAGDGGAPGSGVTLDAAGNVYGTTEAGGLSTCSTFYTGCGVIFELTPLAGGGWKEKVLHAFKDGEDGSNPTTGVIFDAAGNLYGVSGDGGPKNGACPYGCGAAFELTFYQPR
jgi:uncharacterized repeat protein (TIGR03803 family)